MRRFDLNGVWKLEGANKEMHGQIPGSVYSFFLDNKYMDDPYYRDNELSALALMDNVFTFSKTFNFSSSFPVLLHCDGLDTICDIYINGTKIAHTENMHRTYEFEITDLLKKDSENEIKLVFSPVDEYIKERYNKKPVIQQLDCMAGFPYIRKAHCMMGWDWGPMLPDAGIWRDIYLLEKNSLRITDFHITQRHTDGKVFIKPNVSTDNDAQINVQLQSPKGDTLFIDANSEFEIKNPQLWWPNGLGEQPLYTVTANLIENGEIADCQTRKIGLRTLKLIRERDQWGECFCHEVNGIRFFAMGADYIPEDNILSRVTQERTRKLLENCKRDNFNTIRVWGGGYYPDDYFFEICDELGIVVFLDLMFACCEVPYSKEFFDSIKCEIYENLKRIRHHACMGVISGNNEIEQKLIAPIHINESVEARKIYLDLFENIIPNIIGEIAPYIPYIPSSPTSFGGFEEPNNENYGDCHYWQVWHGNMPFTEYRNKFFRYLSEFGFQSFPCEKTMNAVTAPEDRNIFSRIMEMHQRNGNANGKILSYLSETYLYPTDFATLLYTTQLLQAESIKYGVEHFRRNRGRCMGALYWQLNDIWPVASWASIDYYGRYKALQYYAKRFYAPVLISCCETGERESRPMVNMERTIDYVTKAQLSISNETLEKVTGTVNWKLIDGVGNIIKFGKETVCVDALSVLTLDEMDFNKTDVNNNHLYYDFEINGEIISQGTVLFTAPKYFNFKNPNLTYEINGDEITIFAQCYAKSIEIYSPDSDFILSDNFFDMEKGSKTVKIIDGKIKTVILRSIYDIR